MQLNINGQSRLLDVEPDSMLADVIRDDLGLMGTKIGCRVGECGACTVLLDGKAVNSCMIPAFSVSGRSVITIEGLAPEGVLHPIQEAFIEAGAVQCGFCIPGMVMSAKALLDANPNPSREEIAKGISGNLCRCTGYQKILQGVELAAQKLQSSQKGGERS